MAPKTKPPTAGSSSRTQTKPASVKKTKQPIPVPDRLKRLFTSLCAQIDGGHWANAIKTCDKILRLAPDDADALKAKIYLYLQTDQYTAALSLIEATSASNADDVNQQFEKAYALYRMQNLASAREVLQTIKETNAGGEEEKGVLHLEAQIDYREGAYAAALDLYTTLQDITLDPDESADIQTNVHAAQLHLDFLNSGYLRSLDSIPSSLVNSLESSAPPTVASTVQTLPSVNAPAPAAAVKGEAKRNVRASRVPKGVTPGVTPPPDPERWVKKSERSTFGISQGGRKRKGPGGGGGATQGSSAVESAPAAKSGKAAKGKKK